MAVSIGRPSSETSATQGGVAPFSSRGLAFDGFVKPDLVAPGVGLLTADPGKAADGSARYSSISGTSAASAIVAGSAALLAAGQARPGRIRAQGPARRLGEAAPARVGRGAGHRAPRHRGDRGGRGRGASDDAQLRAGDAALGLACDAQARRAQPVVPPADRRVRRRPARSRRRPRARVRVRAVAGADQAARNRDRLRRRARAGADGRPDRGPAHDPSSREQRDPRSVADHGAAAPRRAALVDPSVQQRVPSLRHRTGRALVPGGANRGRRAGRAGRAARAPPPREATARSSESWPSSATSCPDATPSA